MAQLVFFVTWGLAKLTTALQWPSAGPSLNPLRKAEFGRRSHLDSEGETVDRSLSCL